MPQKEYKMLNGRMNLDDPLEVIPKGDHGPCRNMWFRGNPPNMRGENIPGNILLINSFMPGDTGNLTIGRYYDEINNRIFFFNFRSGGFDAIYIYNTISGTFQRLVEENINAEAGALGFSATGIISDINIIYGDSTQGPILYFLDSFGVPKKINIQRALSGGYGVIKSSYMDVAKEPADIPPVVVYENDVSNTVNNLRKKLFKIKLRWVFDDQDKSVTSSQGEMPLPLAPFDQSVDTDATKNCRIAITYQTGPSNVKKIEILAAVSLGNVFSDFFLITSLDKSVEGLSDNDLGTYLFYNDKAYNYIDVQESIQLFDYVPQTAGTQSLLNGNVLTYGNIKEGYPNLTNFTFNSNTSNITGTVTPYYYGTLFSRLVATQDGKSGFGSGNIHIVVRGIIIAQSFALDTFTIYMTDGSTVTYTLNVNDDSAAIIEGLRVNALSKGYTILLNTANDLIISKTGISLARTFITSNYQYNTLFNESLWAYDWLGKHGWGLVYFDAKGRTNGVVYTNGFSVSASAYTEGTSPNDKPIFNATIYHVPPDWAYYYQWVRTKDLKKSNFQQWISDRTFKDDTTTSGIIKYAWISIESLNAFVLANPGSPLGYGFTPGDRITFMKRYNGDTTTANLYGNTKDFEIVASATDPTVNGQIRSGQFIKIILPATDGSFDFGNGFDNYFIELYTPAQSVANGLDVYYEYGERYAIGNPTLSTRFHQGMLQNQSDDHLTPATFEFSKGDFYIKLRSVQAGNVYSYNVINGGMTAGRFLFGLTFSGSTYTDPNITAQSVPFANISGNTPSGGIDPSSDTRWFLKSIPNTTFRIQTTLTISFTTSVPGDTWRIFTLNRFNERKYLQTFDASAAGTYSFNLDFNITLEDDRIFLIAEGQERPLNVFSSTLTASIDHIIPQRMIDKNFSDYFPSAVNSNGRAFVYNENANQVTFPVMYRWSLAYQSDTNINQSNRFYPQNFDNVGRDWGAIVAMRVWNRILTFFQERKCGQTGVYQKFITDSGGNNQLITTDSIITSNNVNYYDGNYGCSNQKDSIVQSGYVYYFYDPIVRKILRLSKDGIIDLTLLYKVQSWASQTAPNYLNPANYPYGGKQRMTGTFNNRSNNEGEYLLVAQGSIVADVIIPGETLAFDERRNAFTDFRDYAPDCILCAENTLYMWQNGYMWKESTSTAYSNFFGVQKIPSITLIFNENEVIKKVFNAFAFQSNHKWGAPTKGDVVTNGINSQTLSIQQSLLMEQDVDVLEAPNSYIDFNRDQNSMSDQTLALWEGDVLRGNFISVKLSYSGNTFTYLYAPYITYQIDPRN